MKFTFKTTMRACFMSNIAHAAVNNFVPLLFITFQQSYDIPLSLITMLVTVNFGVQLIVDMLAARFVDSNSTAKFSRSTHSRVVDLLVFLR